jgi:molybdopterin synthase catalytic subunit
MRVHVKFFAVFREMVGVKTEWKEIAEGTTVEQLWKEYTSHSPRVGTLRVRAAYAVNQRLAKPDEILHDGDEVGFLPPISGGAQKKVERQKRKGKCKNKSSVAPREAFITRKPLDLGALVRRVALPGAGAIVTFSGVVRDNAHGKAVSHLEYESYPEMAEATLRDIIAEIKDRWADARVAMAHRIGKLKIGEASLIIAVAAPHRSEAYAASRYAIEQIGRAHV